MNDDTKVSEARADIPFLATGTYLDNASFSPMSQRVRIASDRFNAVTSERLHDSKAIANEEYKEGRRLAARLIGGSEHGIAYVQNTSHGLSLVALGLDWRAGDNLVVCADEFPSNFLCWSQLSERGVEIRLVSTVEGKLASDAIRDVMDARTRIVAVSHVQFHSGFRVDLAAIGQMCSATRALLVVDGTQSIGAMAIDVSTLGVDVLVASAHKWMMGPRGIGFAWFSDAALDQIKPSIVGWMSVKDPFSFNRTLDFLPDAQRFESGTPNGSGIFGLVERLRQLDDLGSDWIENRILDTRDIIRNQAEQHGIDLVYRFERSASSGIVLLRRDGAATSDIHARLREQNIFTSIRSDAIRVSAHYYNDADEIEKLIHAMK